MLCCVEATAEAAVDPRYSGGSSHQMEKVGLLVEPAERARGRGLVVDLSILRVARAALWCCRCMPCTAVRK